MLEICQGAALGQAGYKIAFTPHPRRVGNGGEKACKTTWRRKGSLKMSSPSFQSCSCICLKPVAKFSASQFPLLFLIWFQLKLPQTLLHILLYTELSSSPLGPQEGDRPFACAPTQLQDHAYEAL